MGRRVKPRYDNKGSEFGEIHRKLPIKFGMFDIDRMKAKASFELMIKKEETGFIEYRTNFTTGEINFKALFEIKYKNSKSAKDGLKCKMGTATWAQRKMAEYLGARYFYVIANNGKQPFDFYEIFYDGRHKFLGTLDYLDRDMDGKQAVRKFWKNNLGLN